MKNIIYSDRKEISGWLGQRGEIVGLTGKENKGNFYTVLYFDCDGCYMGAYNF